MWLILSLALIAGLLISNELWWRQHRVHGELSRKFIHISVGSLVAFWPFFLSWGEIQLLSLAFLIVILLSRYFKIFQAIHSVQRPTYGEVYFAVAVGLVTLLTHNKYIYAAALLQMSLADGLAAVIGTRYGRSQTYYVFGHAKSLIGTATFIAVALAVLFGYNALTDSSIAVASLLATALLAGLIENLGVHGSDNLLVPTLVAVCLRLV